VVYNHTNEADDANPYMTSFRGLDNKVLQSTSLLAATCSKFQVHGETYIMEPHQFLDEFMRKTNCCSCRSITC
jgi:hypothetical protein